MTDTAELPPDPDDDDSTPPGWLSEGELLDAREMLPIVYVNVVPVRTAADGSITEVGLLLRADDDAVSRALVAGRVLYHETIRDALRRNLEKDLGSVAMPRLPMNPTPFSIAEYFPTPGVSEFHDTRQHAIALSYVVPVDGFCEPSQNALDIVWLSPEEAAGANIAQQMMGGQDVLLRRALAYCGVLP